MKRTIVLSGAAALLVAGLVLATVLPAGAVGTPELPLLLRHDIGDAQQVVIVRSASWRSVSVPDPGL